MRKPRNTSKAEVKAAIRRDIDEAPRRPGTLLPTRREMSELYRASTHTIQGALRELEAEGIVIIRPSVGTVVAPNSDTGSQLIARASSGRIYPPGQYATFVFCGTDVPPEEVAEALNLGDGEAAICRRRQRRDAGELVLSQSESWYHPRHATAAPLLLEPKRIIEGSFMYLMKKAGLQAATEDVWVVGRPATDAEAAALTLDDSRMVLVERTVIKADDGEYIEYGISSRPAHVPYPVRVQAPLSI